jgi:integrase
LIPDSPVRKVPKPKSRSRSEEAIISAEDHNKLLEVASPEFRLVLRVRWATGCRPGEIGKITAENINPETTIVHIAEHKTDKSGKPRLIFLPPSIIAELRRLSERFKDGPLLRSKSGQPWTGSAITKAMWRLKVRPG